MATNGAAPEVEVQKPTTGSARPVRLPSEDGGSQSSESGVLVFPEIVLPPPEAPARGPLFWAYWSARRK